MEAVFFSTVPSHARARPKGWLCCGFSCVRASCDLAATWRVAYFRKPANGMDTARTMDCTREFWSLQEGGRCPWVVGSGWFSQGRVPCVG